MIIFFWNDLGRIESWPREKQKNQKKLRSARNNKKFTRDWKHQDEENRAHREIPFSLGSFIFLGRMQFLFVGRHNPLLDPLSVLYNHIVNNLPAEDASPAPKMFSATDELFVSHGSTTAITLHVWLPPWNYQGVYQDGFPRSIRIQSVRFGLKTESPSLR
jgi:hypothetical protein